uniref:Uncharacterized protein n=1 Tax=Glossina austeni TaxID=7395 RepID=A0A1A9V5P3_GLOAU
MYPRTTVAIAFTLFVNDADDDDTADTFLSFNTFEPQQFLFFIEHIMRIMSVESILFLTNNMQQSCYQLKTDLTSFVVGVANDDNYYYLKYTKYLWGLKFIDVNIRFPNYHITVTLALFARLKVTGDMEQV